MLSRLRFLSSKIGKLRKSSSRVLKDSEVFGTWTDDDVRKRHERIRKPIQLQESSFENAIVYPRREVALRCMPIKPKNVLEVGTLAGDFAQFMIELWFPNKVCLVDYFNSPDYIFHEPRFTSSTHYEYVSRRFQNVKSLEVMKGESSRKLSELRDRSEKFDFIYIDAGHTFEDVREDLEIASHLLEVGGVIGMNDYIMTDYYYDTLYGVVQATNEFLTRNNNFKVIAYALNDNLFSDIYLQKKV